MYDRNEGTSGDGDELDMQERRRDRKGRSAVRIRNKPERQVDDAAQPRCIFFFPPSAFGFVLLFRVAFVVAAGIGEG